MRKKYFCGNEYEVHDDKSMYFIPFNDRTSQLHTCPHYTENEFFNNGEYGELTVYGTKDNSLHYVYDDRMEQWNYDKMKEATKRANEPGEKLRSARWYDVLLSYYFGKKCELRHATACVNRSNGFPVAALGYKEI